MVDWADLRVRITIGILSIIVAASAWCSVVGFSLRGDGSTASSYAIVSAVISAILALVLFADSVRFRDIPWRVAIPTALASIGAITVVVAAANLAVSIAIGIVSVIGILLAIRGRPPPFPGGGNHS